MDRFESIVKDFTRAWAPAILEVPGNGAQNIWAGPAELSRPVSVTPLSIELFQTYACLASGSVTPIAPLRSGPSARSFHVSRINLHVRVALARPGCFGSRAASAM
jgi:hypothetical protein